MEIDPFVVIGIIIVLSLIAFFALVFFFPEWVGITGKRAKEVQDHQKNKD